MITMTNLTFEIDNINGVGARLAGQYADWTIENIEWWDASGSEPVATGQSLYTPETMTATSYHAVVTATNPEGTETVTLTSANVSGTESTSFGGTSREFYVEDLDGQIQAAAASFGDHNVSGVLFRLEFHDGAPNNIYVTEANGVFTEYQYDTLTGQQGYIAAEDREDAFDWTYLTTYFDDGEVAEIEEVGDDGVVFVQSFSPTGEVEYISMADEQNAHDYEFTEQTFQYGAVASSFERLDDGLETTKQYHRGELQSVAMVDTNDAYNYVVNERLYDEWGGYTQFTLYDDGRVLTSVYAPEEDGSGFRTVYWEMSDTEDAYSWSSQERWYDENNDLAAKLVIADDGVATSTTYEGGVRVEVNVNDFEDARAFTTITRQYEDGVLANKVTQLDNGRVNHSTYDSDGQRTTTTSIDTADAFVWTEQTRTFDADGNSELFRLHDDGVEQTLTYLDDERTSSVREDAGDAHAWHSITDQFEDTVRVSRDIIWDSDLIG